MKDLRDLKDFEGYPSVVLRAVASLLEPFVGIYRQKLTKYSKINLLSRFEGPCVVTPPPPTPPGVRDKKI